MSVQATTAVWNHSKAVGNERLVLLALADHAHPDGTNARPGEQTIVSMTKISARSVRDQLRSLRDRGEIEVTAKAAPGQVTEYRIILPGLGTAAKSATDSTAANPRTNGGENASSRRRERVSSPLINPMNPMNPETLAPKARERNLLFDAVAEACQINPDELTASYRGAFGKAVKDLKAVGATPDEIRRRATNWESLFPQATLTPPALAKHWAQLGQARAPTQRPDRFVQMATSLNQRLGGEDEQARSVTSETRRSLPRG